MNDTMCVARQPGILETLIDRIRRLFRKRGPSNSELHALREFRAAGYLPIDQCENGPDKWMQENVIELLRVFSKQGHSGFSAMHCIETFRKLAKFEPLAPLSGNDDEWMDVSEYGSRDGGKVYQNNRCSHVFKEDGQAYDSNGVVFEEPDGGRFTGYHSRVPVTFPYTQKTVIVKVPNDATDEQKIQAAKQALTAADA